MRRFSRLARKEEKRNLKRATTFGILSVAIILLVIFLGIPMMIKLAVFLGNLRSSSLPIERGDTLPPRPPILNSPSEATNSSQLAVSGLAEPGSEIEIFLNDRSVTGVIADSDGNFQIEGLSLVSGKNEFYALSTDKAGNKSTQSQKVVVLFDNTPPDLEITLPAVDLRISQSSKIEIVGKTEPEATVIINDRLVVVDSQGLFRYTLGLSVGDNSIKIAATDKAGNKAEKEILLNYSP